MRRVVLRHQNDTRLRTAVSCAPRRVRVCVRLVPCRWSILVLVLQCAGLGGSFGYTGGKHLRGAHRCARESMHFLCVAVVPPPPCADAGPGAVLARGTRPLWSTACT